MAERTRYNWFDKLLHWLIVLNLGLTLIFARGMPDLPLAERVQEYGDHGLSVTTLLILMTIRLIWRLTHPAPPLPEDMKPWEKLSAKIVHWGLYVLVFTQIGIGILLASTTDADFVARGYGINYTAFGLMPESANDLMLTLHNIVYWSIVSFIAIHILAALKHAIVDRDRVLQRMLPFTRGA